MPIRWIIQLPNSEGTSADTACLETIVGYKPATEIEDGIARFVEWYREWAG